MRLITSAGMSCWSGFWFFVSCHSVMAFPSFTIRWTGAEMLYFHFPVVGNSRWPGDAFFSVLLHEQFTTWSATFFRCSSCGRCSYSTGLTWALPDKHIWTCAWGGVPGRSAGAELGLALLVSKGLTYIWMWNRNLTPILNVFILLRIFWYMNIQHASFV